MQSHKKEYERNVYINWEYFAQAFLIKYIKTQKLTALDTPLIRSTLEIFLKSFTKIPTKRVQLLQLFWFFVGGVSYQFDIDPNENIRSHIWKHLEMIFAKKPIMSSLTVAEKMDALSTDKRIKFYRNFEGDKKNLHKSVFWFRVTFQRFYKQKQITKPLFAEFWNSFVTGGSLKNKPNKLNKEAREFEFKLIFPQFKKYLTEELYLNISRRKIKKIYDDFISLTFEHTYLFNELYSKLLKSKWYRNICDKDTLKRIFRLDVLKITGTMESILKQFLYS